MEKIMNRHFRAAHNSRHQRRQNIPWMSENTGRHFVHVARRMHIFVRRQRHRKPRRH